MTKTIIIKTEAVTLRIAPFSNTSHIVTWLTPGHGKIATVVKGACRPKSPAFGQYDTGFLCELLFYARSHNGLHIIKECSTINSRRICRGNWQITAAISYLCHLAGIATPDGAHAPELYNILSSTLDRITPPHAVSPLTLSATLLQFELHLMQTLGIAPRLNSCTGCRATVTPRENSHFSAIKGGILCSSCNAASRTTDSLSLSGGTLAVLQRWQASHDFKLLQNSKCDQKQKAEIERVMGSFLIYHLDLAPACRATAYQTINIPKS